jgi:hypothetical protein
MVPRTDRSSAAGRTPTLMAADPYRQRRAVLTTRHDKLTLVAPPLWATLGLTVVAIDADTDALGTFSGEIPRPASPIDTAIAKARLGMAMAGVPIGLASEGTVADVTGMGLLCADIELVVLVDDEREIVVTGRASSTAVVTIATSVGADEPVDAVLQRGGVPPHHLVVSPDGVVPTTATGELDPRWIAGTTKGVGDGATLIHAVAVAVAASPLRRARVQSDLRAHRCPSRRRVIAAAASDLAVRLATPCPHCAGPGWGPHGTESGRRCSWCDGPTDEVAAERWRCPGCGHHDVRLVDDGRPGDPARCPRCNP